MKYITNENMRCVIDCIDDSLKEEINHVDYSMELNTLSLSTLAKVPQINLSLEEVKQFSSVTLAYLMWITDINIDVAEKILSQVKLTPEARRVLIKIALLSISNENNDTLYDP